MNEEQLKLFIRHAFSLENSAQSALRRADPGFARAMAGIRNLVGTLPDQSLMREQEWQAMLGQVAAELEPYNQAFAEAVVEEMVAATPEMQQTASEMISRAGVQVPPAAGIPVQDSVRLALDSKVNSTRLSTLFNTDGGAGMSPWIRDNMRVIDRTVKTGILQGKLTKDIADEIAVAMVRNGQEVLSFNGPTAARQIRTQANAIARTAVQDMNRQVKEVVWKANAEVIAVGNLMLEWVAALDSRTCPTCGPLDGTRHKKQSSFPAPPPIHVNCRCQLVLVDPEDPAAIRTGQQVSVEQPTGEGAYKTKVKVKGDKLYRKAKNVQLGPDGQRPSYADYLAQSDRKTQQMYFGGGNAGSLRAERFNALVKAGNSPEVALKQLVVGDAAKRGFVPVSKLPPVTKPKAPIRKKAASPKPKVSVEVKPLTGAEAAKAWAEGDYNKMAAAQLSEAKAAGKQLNPYELKQAEAFEKKGSAFDRQRELQKAQALNSAVVRAPEKYDGMVYRGVGLRNQAEVDDLVKSLGRESNSLQSWTQSPTAAKRFAAGYSSDGTGGRITHQVLIKQETKNGVQIEKLLGPDGTKYLGDVREKEVLLPRGNKTFVEKVTQRVKKDRFGNDYTEVVIELTDKAPAPKPKAVSEMTPKEIAREREATIARLKARQAAREAAAAPPPPPAPKPKAPSLADRVLEPGPQNKLVFAKQGGTSKMFDDSWNLLEQVDGEVGANARKMRQFMEKQDVMTHPAIPEKFSNADRFKGNEALLRSQRRAVEVLEKQGNDPGALAGARGLLKSLEAGDFDELKHVMGKASGAAGYTTRSSGIVNAAMTPNSTTFDKKRIQRLISSAEDSLKQQNAYIDYYKEYKAGTVAPKPSWNASGLGTGAALDPDQWLSTTIHEVGHQVHFRGAAGTKLANKYKGLGGERFVSQYSHTNEREQFAEAFVHYVLNPKGLKTSHPRLYQWVDDALKEALK